MVRRKKEKIVVVDVVEEVEEAEAVEATEDDGDADDDDDDDVDVPEDENLRRALFRDSFLELRATLGAVGEDSVCEAIDLCVAILERPGPEDRAALAPAMKLVYTRLAAFYRRSARALRGKDRKDSYRHARDAEQDAKHMAEVMRRIGPPIRS